MIVDLMSSILHPIVPLVGLTTYQLSLPERGVLSENTDLFLLESICQLPERPRSYSYFNSFQEHIGAIQEYPRPSFETGVDEYHLTRMRNSQFTWKLLNEYSTSCSPTSN